MVNAPKIPKRDMTARMKFRTITLSKEEARQIIYGDHEKAMEVENKITDTSRWSIHHSLIFELDGKHYQMKYSHGATESQDEQPFEYEDTVECVEVEPHEVKVTQWLAVEVK